MDIKRFLKFILRFKWLLIIVPLLCAAITYFFVKNLPQEFGSEVEISTGLLDPSKKIISNETVDFYKVSLQFSTIMEKMKMKRIINILSYYLMLHDLENPTQTFRIYSKTIDSLGNSEKQELIALLRNKLESKALLTLADNKGKFKLYNLVESMGNGEVTLQEK